MVQIPAVVTEDGTLKIKDPQTWLGEEILLSIEKKTTEINESNCAQILEIFHEADALDFPRRNPEEIMCDLWEFKET